MKCEKCDHNLFYIDIIPCCSDCSENGAYVWDDILPRQSLLYEEKEIDEADLNRDQVEHDGECRVGIAYGNGCWLIICQKCRNKINLPMQEAC